MAASGWMRELFDIELMLLSARIGWLELKRDLALGRPARLAKYSPDQPRVPAGNPDGGQWTSGGGGEDESLGEWANGEGDAQIHLATNRPRAGFGRWPNATPAQQARLAASELQARAAIRRVQEIDSRWKPPASISEGIEGAITTNQAVVRQAEARLRELQGMGIGLGPFAAESLPARGEERNFNTGERRDMNRIGSTFGCHTCGTMVPGTTSGNFILDHQIPNGLNQAGRAQRLFPHCLSCSLRQGGSVGRILGAK